jgi:hypothetical protein
MLSFVFILSLFLPEIFLQLIYLRLDLNRLLRLLLLLHNNLVLHMFAYISDSPGLFFPFPPRFISFLLYLFQQHTTPIHLRIHRFNDLLRLLYGLLLHLHLLLLLLSPEPDLRALLLLDLQSVQQVTLEHLELRPRVLLVQQLPVHHVAPQRQVLLLLLRLVVQVADVVVPRPHLVRHLDYQVVQLSLRHVQLLVRGVQGGQLPVQAQNLLLTVCQSQFAFEERRTSFG